MLNNKGLVKLTRDTINDLYMESYAIYVERIDDFVK